MTWTYPIPQEIPTDLLAWAGSDLLAQLLVQRGLTTVEAAQAFIDPDYYEPALASDLPDIDQAVALLCQAIEQAGVICVWGDFDVDGQTSTALLVSMLQALGAKVQYYVPQRLTEGHGVNLDRLQAFLQDGVDLILTCDTGIEAYEAVDLVHEAGAKIIITDHHDLGDTLPPASAVINPKRLTPDHPLRELPGVGVAYKLTEALYQAQGQSRLAEDFLDLVALGIVADVAVQTGDTRYLLQRGLQILRQTERTGLQALLSMTNLKQEQLTSEHIGFYLGPRLNALGRLGDANQAVELLTTTDKGRARILAAQLDALNTRRKMLVERTVVQAFSLLADTPSLLEHRAIVLASSDWHPGVLGLACSRLTAQYHRPAILLTEREGLLQGSARSVEGCDIHQAIKTQADLLHRFGGHPMAAGLSLVSENLTAFRNGLSSALADGVSAPTGSAGTKVSAAPSPLHIDVKVKLSQVDIPLLHILQQLAPFGQGNPPVTLAVADVSIQQASHFGATRAHRRVVVGDNMENTLPVVWWNGAAETLPEGPFNLALHLQRDDYRKKEAVQAIWVEAQSLIPQADQPKREIIDLRQQEDLSKLLTDTEAFFWATETLPGLKRLTTQDLGQASIKKLVLWQAPPDQEGLQQLLADLQPEQLYLVARPSGYDKLPTFMQHLLGLIKYGLKHYQGRLIIRDLALATGHRPETIRLALRWLISQGKLQLLTETEESFIVQPHQGGAITGGEVLRDILIELLRETAAYRQFVGRASLVGLGLQDQTSDKQPNC